MPIKKSATKELRKTVKRTAYNSKRKRAIKDTVKSICKAVASGKLDEAKKLAQDAVKLLDKAAKRNIIHKNKAARKKSRILKTIKKAAVKK